MLSFVAFSALFVDPCRALSTLGKARREVACFELCPATRQRAAIENCPSPASVLPQHHSKQGPHLMPAYLWMCFVPALPPSFGSLCPASARILLTITTTPLYHTHSMTDTPLAFAFTASHHWRQHHPRKHGQSCDKGKVRRLWLCLRLCCC